LTGVITDIGNIPERFPLGHIEIGGKRKRNAMNDIAGSEMVAAPLREKRMRN
jgi:hypothetical protein